MSDVLTAVLPSLGVLAIFVIVLRAIVHADRRERAAAARFESAAPDTHGNRTTDDGAASRGGSE